MSFINWGSESPEQLAIRRRIEEEAIYEQAVRVRMAQAIPVAGVGGGSKKADNRYFAVSASAENGYSTSVKINNHNKLKNTRLKVAWGDGSVDSIEGYELRLTHEYEAGEYQLVVIITGEPAGNFEISGPITNYVTFDWSSISSSLTSLNIRVNAGYALSYPVFDWGAAIPSSVVALTIYLESTQYLSAGLLNIRSLFILVHEVEPVIDFSGTELPNLEGLLIYGPQSREVAPVVMGLHLTGFVKLDYLGLMGVQLTDLNLDACDLRELRLENCEIPLITDGRVGDRGVTVLNHRSTRLQVDVPAQIISIQAGALTQLTGSAFSSQLYIIDLIGSGITDLDLSSCSALAGFYFIDCAALTGLLLPDLAGCTGARVVRTLFDSNKIDELLVKLAANPVINGQCVLVNTSTPGTAGLAAIATLTSRGWTIQLH